MKIYFDLQYKRLIRSLRELGVNTYLGILLIAGAFILLSTLVFKKVAHAQYLYSVLTVMLVYPLGNVKRNEFLKNIFTKNEYRKIRLLENVLFCLPFYFFLLFKHQYIFAFSTVVFGALCSLFNKTDRSAFVIPTPFLKRPFEFTVGFRKTYWLLLFLYIVTYIALSVDNFNLGVVALLGSALVCTSFYAMPEPVFYVWVHTQPSCDFLKNKIKTAILYCLFVILPLAFPLIFCFPLKAYIVLIVVIIGLLYIVMSVVVKYANYPGEIGLTNILKMSFGLIFPPALLVLIPYFYIQSVRKLSIFLK